jgi:hypothetical protein
MFGSFLIPFCFVGSSCFINVICIYVRIPVSNTISVSFNRTVTWRVSHMEQELLTLPEHLSSLSVFSGLLVARSLVFCVVFCVSLFVLLSFLSRLDLRLLITLQTFLNKQHYTKRTIIIIIFKYLIHKQL